MKDGVKGKLDSVFEEHQKREQAAAERKQAAVRAAEDFEGEFRKVAESVIQPALEEVVQYLSQKNQQSRIEKVPEGTGYGQVSHRLSIALRLVFQGETYRSPNETANLQFIADLGKKEVTVFENTLRPNSGGQTGATGSVSLGEVTQEFVQESAAAWLARVFR